jgi:hypothetical protein
MLAPAEHVSIQARYWLETQKTALAYGVSIPTTIELWEWEARLDNAFTAPVSTKDWNRYHVLSMGWFEVGEPLISWRSLVSTRLRKIDGVALHVSIPGSERATLMPALAVALALMGTSLPGHEPFERCFIPCDDTEMSDWFGGVTYDEKDHCFYEMLDALTDVQRGCLRQFVEWHFSGYLVVAKTEINRLAKRSALDRLLSIWQRG